MVARIRVSAGFALGMVLLLALGGTALANPGQVDTRYGFSGTVDITDALPGPEFQRGVLAEAVGPEDESVVLSYATRPCPGVRTCADLYVTRVLPDGTVDAAFGARAGVVASVEWASPSIGDGPRGAIGVQSDGKVVVASGNGLSALIARLDQDGGHDVTFHEPGVPIPGTLGQVNRFFGAEATVSSLAIRPKGGFVLAGSAAFPLGPSAFVSRTLDQGQADQEFGTGGTVFTGLGGDDLPATVALRGASTLVGGPACCTASATGMSVAELDAVGRPARSLTVRVPNRLGAGVPKGISTLIPGPKGSTFVVGSAAKGTFVAKYRRNGRPDDRFRDRGFALVRGLTSETPSSAVLDSKGRIVVLGRRLDVPDTEGFRARYVASVRLLPNGKLDQTYGGTRPLLVIEEGGTKVGLDFNRSFGLVRRSDGLLMMLGEAAANRYARMPSGPDFGLVRFLAGGRLR